MHQPIRTPRRTSLRSAAVALSAAALAAGVLVTPAASAAPAAAATTKTDGTPSSIAASWLAGELTNGLVVGKTGPDFGLTIDAGMALSTVSGQGGAVEAISTALEPRIGDYVGDGKDELRAGALAKVATFARTAKKNPTSYGGRNLVTELEGRTADATTKEGAANPLAGRISDKAKNGDDFANTVGQSYAVRALSLAGSAEAATARDFLLKQQCPSGYFRLGFDNPDVPSQSCTEGVAGSPADPDATSIAVINLIESRDSSPTVQAALAKAGTWLADRQRGSGAIRGGAGTAVINANSTSLGAYALGLLKNRDAAMKSALWVRKLQPVDKYKCRTALTKDVGAVAYRKDRLAPAKTGGIPADARDEWRRVTAQAVLGLQFAPASNDDLRIVSQRREARAGDRPQFTVYGLAPGESACVQVKGDFKKLVGKTSGGKIVRKLQLPAGNQRRVALVKTSDDEARTSLRVRN
jgi:hypothetical protein